MSNEAGARLKINALLQKAGWCLTEYDGSKVNVRVENHLVTARGDEDTLGDDFEKSGGFADYVLYDDKNFPSCVLEAKSEGKNPLVAKEQARDYAKSLNVSYVILSNSNKHYFWDITEGDPYEIGMLPSPDSFEGTPVNKSQSLNNFINLETENDFIVLTQYPEYKKDPLWRGKSTSSLELIEKFNLCFLRNYQVEAVQSIQKAVSNGKDKFLFEMATGTGKTSTSAAVIRAFFKAQLAKRTLFLVDRLELEDQAERALKSLLKPDLTAVKYKDELDSWQRAEIVVTTIQSIINKYDKVFAPTDFDLIISDEAHRLISGEGSTRSVFNYFVGYKLGLTATPKNLLKNFTPRDFATGDPQEIERRKLYSTYFTFGCEDLIPTFSYTLADGVRDGFLVNPTVIDCRTEVTTGLLSEQGFTAEVTLDDEGNVVEGTFDYKDYEKQFFSEATNRACMETFLDNASVDPITGEIGKTIVFAVSQNHAAKLAQILNEYATQKWPGKYNSDFALQVTSDVKNAQNFTIRFNNRNNNLSGTTKWAEGYKSSKTRVCVTVAMMTTGYDCQDILNICLMRPIFSPTEFIQIKGRGTRTYGFKFVKRDGSVEASIEEKKQGFKLFDYFANCEYFNEKYDDTIKPKLPKRKTEPTPIGPRGGDGIDEPLPHFGEYRGSDLMILIEESVVAPEGMPIDQILRQKTQEEKERLEYQLKKGEEKYLEFIVRLKNKDRDNANIHPFFLIAWNNPTFLKDMTDGNIGKYTAKSDIWKIIKETPVEVRDKIVGFINDQVKN